MVEDVSYKWYSVFHKPGMSLSQALNQSTPIRGEGRKYRGHTQWNIKWHFDWEVDSEGRCHISESTTDLTAVITIPGLVSSDEKAKAKFSRYIANLKTHEMGHVEIARKAAMDIDKGILSLPAMNTCEELNSAANRLGQARLQMARDEGDQYDVKTQHGRTQGVFIK